MKNLILFIAAVGLLTAVSCDKESPMEDDSAYTREGANDSTKQSGISLDTTWVDPADTIGFEKRELYS